MESLEVRMLLSVPNVAPAFTVGPDVRLGEDAGPQRIQGWAGGISPGASNEIGQSLSFQVIANSNPTLFKSGPTLTPDGTLRFQTAADAFGAATISLQLQDSGGTADGGIDTSGPQSFTITVDPIDDAPVGVDDVFLVDKGRPMTVRATPPSTFLRMDSQGMTYTPASGVFFVDGNPQAISVRYEGGQSQPIWMTFGAPMGQVLAPRRYPDAARWPFQAPNQAGLDISIGSSGNNTSQGAFTIRQIEFGLDGKPIRFAADFVNEGGVSAAGTVEYNARVRSGVLKNDTDAEYDSLLIARLVTPTAHGQLAFNPDGTFTYTPDAGFEGTDQFTYVPGDGHSEGAETTVHLMVTPINEAPTFTGGADCTVDEDAGPVVLQNWATDLSPGGPDETAQALQFVVTANSDPGLFSDEPAIDGTGTLRFAARPDAWGSATVTIVLKDDGGVGLGGSDTSEEHTFTITVRPVNDVPVAQNDFYETTPGQPLVLSKLPDTFIQIDSDSQDPIGGGGHWFFDRQQILSCGVDTYPAGSFHTQISLGAYDGSWWWLKFAAPAGEQFQNRSYIGALDYPNQGSAAGMNIYRGYGPEPLVTGNFTIQKLETSGDHLQIFAATFEEHAPGAAGALRGTIHFNYPTASGVVANDSDADGDILAATLVDAPQHGTLALNSDGTLTYTPAARFHGIDRFTYRVSDGTAEGNLATATISVADNSGYTPPPDQFGTEADPATVHLGSFIDNDGSDWTVNVDWGDSTTTTIAMGRDGAIPDQDHTYADNGIYQVTVTVERPDGAVVAIKQFRMELANQPRQLSVGGSGSQEVNKQYVISLASEDPGDDQVTGWTVNWGDGQVSLFEGDAAEASHTYTSSGSYMISIAVTDEDGSYTAVSPVRITGLPATVTGHIYSDVNYDETLQPREKGVGGVKVFVDSNWNGLLDADEAQTTSLPDGSYRLEDVEAEVGVRIFSIPPKGWVCPSPPTRWFAAQEGVTGADLPLWRGGTVAGAVFNDANENAARGTEEKGLPGRKVYLDLDRDGALDTDEPWTTTDVRGGFAFSGLSFGVYRVGIVSVRGWRASRKSQASVATVKLGQRSPTLLIAQTQRIGLVGNVFLDANHNGAWDMSEGGLAGQRVFLDQNGNARLDWGEQSFLTGKNGLFNPAGLRAGNYSLYVLGSRGSVAPGGVLQLEAGTVVRTRQIAVLTSGSGWMG